METKTLLRWNVHVVLQAHKKSKHWNKNIVKMKHPCCFTTIQAHKKSKHGNKNTIKMKFPCCFTITQACCFTITQACCFTITQACMKHKHGNKNTIKTKFPCCFTTPEAHKKSKHGNKTKTLLRWNVHVVLQHNPCGFYILNSSKATTL